MKIRLNKNMIISRIDRTDDSWAIWSKKSLVGEAVTLSFPYKGGYKGFTISEKSELAIKKLYE